MTRIIKPQTFVLLINPVIVKGENYMGDKIEITGNVRDSVVNVKTDLSRVHQSINYSSETNSFFKHELQNLNSQLEKELRQVPDKNEEEIEVIREYARRLIEEAEKPKPNKTLIKISGEGLMTAAKNLAAIAPTVLSITGQIIETIARYATIYSPP